MHVNLRANGNCVVLKMQVFVVDKDDAEIAAIRAVFGDTVEIRICYFHVMQASERWLRRRDNGVTDKDKVAIMNLFAELKFAQGMGQ
jgi:hypothetical protein